MVIDYYSIRDPVPGNYLVANPAEMNLNSDNIIAILFLLV